MTASLFESSQARFTRARTYASAARVRVSHFPACLPSSHATSHGNACNIETRNVLNHVVEVEKDCSGNFTCIISRRNLVATALAIATAGFAGEVAVADTSAIDILEEHIGIGSHGARRGDLLLFHYVGRLEATGQVFDSTRGGLTYRDGGPGVLRPAAIALGGGPVPGICEGLQQALTGMSIGGRRTVRVPPALGFGSQTVLAPYSVVPANSTLLYEVELLRLSAVGPDQLTKGISKCGAGGANQQAENCANVSYAEFL
ncbi:hypothetical protein Vretimale_8615 [Volvox reticuliferus]|uniref:peptidylprolyl isomerase n=1 Tax=Volvox reticuliferus TaxID=1737510 RepID=A0A8J4GBU3_9CHLO|nr:hypothetical protein Vretimale_8615 [Volvox reticuliferus]